MLGGPKQVGSNYLCARNYLTTFEGCPRVIPGNFDYSTNKILGFETKGAPRVGGEINIGYQNNPYHGDDLSLWEHVDRSEYEEKYGETEDEINEMDEAFFSSTSNHFFKAKKESYKKTLELIKNFDKKYKTFDDDELDEGVKNSLGKNEEKDISFIHNPFIRNQKTRSQIPLEFKNNYYMSRGKVYNNYKLNAKLEKGNDEKTGTMTSFKKMMLYFSRIIYKLLSKKKEKIENTTISIKNECFENKIDILNNLVNKYKSENTNKYTKDLDKSCFSKLESINTIIISLANNSKDLDIEDKKMLYKVVTQFIPSVFEAYENVADKEINGVNQTNSHQILEESLTTIYNKVKEVNDNLQERQISKLSVINRNIKASLG